MKNQIKKVLSFVLVVVMCLSTFAIGAYAEEECLHANKELRDEKEATCDAWGYKSYKCPDCGKDFVEDMTAPLGHDYVESGTSDATCENEAGKKFECSRCDAEYDVPGAAIPDGECEFDEENVEYVLEDGELKGYVTCEVCGNKKEVEVDDAHIHEAEAMTAVVVTKPDCDTDGVMKFECEYCDYVIENVKIPKGHQYGDKIAKDPASCTEDGMEEHYVCELCGEYFDKDKKPTTAAALVIEEGHDLEKTATKVTEEDCLNRQYAVYKWECKNCDYTENKAETAFVHQYIESDASYGATCVTYGFSFKVCELCGDSTSEKLNPKGHLISLGTNATAATDDVRILVADLLKDANVTKYEPREVEICGDYPYYVYICLDENCPTAHPWDETDGCEFDAHGEDCEEGCTIDHCTFEHEATGEVWVQNVNGEKGEHPEWVEAEDNDPKPADCEEGGKKPHFICTECGADDPERDGTDTDKLGHAWADEIAYCSVTEKAYKVCEVCDEMVELTEEEYEDFEAPEGVSHVLVETIEKEATCDKAGSKIITCAEDDCPHWVAEVIDALGHDWAEEPIVVDANCTERAMKLYECLNDCGEVRSELGTELDTTAAGHIKYMDAQAAKDPEGYKSFKEALAAATPIVPATCTQKAIYRIECACGETFTYEGEYGHDVDEDHEEAPICALEQNGKKGSYCLYCEKWLEGQYEEIPFEHNAEGEVVAKSLHIAIGAEYYEYGWNEFTYCTACQDYEEYIHEGDAANDVEADPDFVAPESRAAKELLARRKTHKYEDTKATFEGYDSTCTTKGIETFDYCTVCCDAEDIEDLKADNEIDMLDHLKETRTVTADCDDDGYTLKYCANCDAFEITGFDYANGHKWLDGEDGEDDTDYEENLNDKANGYDCTKPGYKYYKCENCDAHKEIEGTRVEAHHVNSDGESFTSSCVDIEETTTCIWCGEVEVYHNTNEEPAVKVPTCTEPGYKVSNCADCDYTETEIFADLETFLKEMWAEEADEDEEFPFEEVHALLYFEGEWGYCVFDEEELKWTFEDIDEDDIEFVEDKYEEPTHTTEGKLVYVCPCCEEEVEVVLEKLVGIEMNITAANGGLVPAPYVVNGGLVTFTVTLDAANIEAAALKAEFFYDASVLTFVGAEINGIFDVVDEAGNTTVTTNKVYGNSVISTYIPNSYGAFEELNMGCVSIIADASLSAEMYPVDVKLDGTDIAFATLTFRVAADAEAENVLSGYITNLATADEEKLIDANLDLYLEYMVYQMTGFKLYDELEEAEENYEDARLNGDLISQYRAAEALEAAEKAFNDFEAEYNAWFEKNEEKLDSIDLEDMPTAECEFDIAKLGDVNGDGFIDVVDALAIRKMQFTDLDGTVEDGEYAIVDENDENDEPIYVEINYLVEADVDMNGEVDLRDYALLNQYLVKNITYTELVLTSQADAQ